MCLLYISKDSIEQSHQHSLMKYSLTSNRISTRQPLHQMIPRSQHPSPPGASLARPRRKLLHHRARHSLQPRLIQRMAEVRNTIPIPLLPWRENNAMHRRLEQPARPIFQQIPEIDQNGESVVGGARWRLARRINRHTRPLASLRANLQPRLPRELEEQRHGAEIGVRARADVDVGFVLWCAGVVQQAQHGARLPAGCIVAGGKPFFVREGEGARELPEES